MKIYKLLLVLFLLLIVGGCRKQSPDLYNQNHNMMLGSPSEIFLSYWHGMNNSYIFWEIDPTDWDKVYDEYLPRFQALDSQDNVSTHQLKQLYTELSKDLIDHHYTLTITNSKAHPDSTSQFTIRPSINQVKKRNYYHDFDTNFTLSLYKNIIKYKSENRIQNYRGVIHKNGFVIFSYNIDNGIAYIYFNTFSISEFMKNMIKDNIDIVETVLNFNDMILNMPNLRGVIVDMRNNGGGSLSDTEYILAPMLDKALHFAYTRSKNGLGRYDYEGWVPAIVHPAVKHRKIKVPVVALVNLYSVSMSEMTASAIKMLDNGYVVGERTFGGTGPLTDYDYNYGGSFKNKNVDVYSSSLMMKMIDDGIIEGVGVTPDLEILDDPKALSNGLDVQLEAAIKLIKEKSKK